MTKLKTVFVIVLIVTISCVNNFDEKDIENKKYYFKENRAFIYSIHEINKIDSIDVTDSSIGVMVIHIGRKDSVRSFPVNRWTIATEYYSGNTHPSDSIFTSYDYIQETDSFLYSRAYPSNYEEHSGILMKRKLYDQTDSVTSLGDSVQIENIDVKTFCKKPSIGLKWIFRPDWLEYKVDIREEVSVLDHKFNCYRINASPLNSHPSTINESEYSQKSWITEDKIVKTLLSHSLADSIWSSTNYFKIELIDDITDSKDIPVPSSYKEKAIKQGWD